MVFFVVPAACVALAATRLLYDGVKFIDRRFAMRKASKQRLDAIWNTVEQNPGSSPGRVAQKLGVPRSSVTRALPALEEEGMLLALRRADQQGTRRGAEAE